MPYQTATNPQTGEKLINVDGSWQKLDQSATNPKTGEKAYRVGSQWLTEPRTAQKATGLDTQALAKPSATAGGAKPGLFGDPNPMPSPMTEAISEPFMKAVTGIGATAVGGLRSLAGALGGDPNSAEKGQSLAQSLTYEPPSKTGQAVSKAIEYPGTQLAKGADVIGRNVAAGTGSPALGAFANTATQAAAQALLGKGAGIAGDLAGLGKGATVAAGATVRGAARAEPTLELAKDFATKKLGAQWEELPPGIQKKLKTAARDPAELNKLDAKAVEVEARAERLKMPLTRGQATRDPVQLGAESRASKSAGSPISKIKAAQDESLHTALDETRESAGGTAQTREALGKSVQNEALRPKVAQSIRNYNRLFKTARSTEPDAATAPHALYDLLDMNPEIQHLGFMESWLKKAKVKTKGPGTDIDLGSDISKAKAVAAGAEDNKIQIRNVKLSELEDLRRKAAGIARKGGDNAYYAGEVVKTIDEAFDKIPAAAKAWKEARDAFKQHKLEFDDQKIVKDLATDKSRTDRRVGLTDTAQKIMGHDAEDIVKLKKSLTQGGTAETRAAGEKAWRNIRAGVIDYLREKAHGKRANVNENRQDEFNSSFREAFLELDEDGKIDVIFNKEQAKKLREIYEAVLDVRMEPSSRRHGSDTVANQQAQKVENTLSMLEKWSKIPLIGKPMAGTVGLARSVWDSGAATRAAAHAKTTPLSEAASTAKSTRAKADKKRRNDPNTLKSLKRAGRTSRLTLQSQQGQQE